MEFCLLPPFMGEHAERQRQHADDQVFFGVCELLALKLSDAGEIKLWHCLSEHAADTQRSDLLNRYTIALGRRVALDPSVEPGQSQFDGRPIFGWIAPKIGSGPP